ncbi:type II and III secretion system protein [bacterium]|nr:type II and III secretion system protein [bacterium]
MAWRRCWVLLVSSLGWAPPLSADPPLTAEPMSRILYLYYYPDARHVVEVLRGHAISEVEAKEPASVLALDQAIEQVKESRARAERQLENPSPRPDGGSLLTTALSSTVPSPSDSITQAQLQAEAAAAGLRAKEAALEERRFDVNEPDQDQILAPGDPASPDPASQVTISVVGKGMIHLQGPPKGVHRLARMVHEIDRPVGRVKVGIHTIQFELPDGEHVERVHDMFEQHIRHARQLTIRSMELFRQSFNESIQKRKGPNDHPQCPVQIFCPRFLEEMGRCKRSSGHEAAESLAESLRSLDLLGTLYLTALANDNFRDEVWTRFDKLVETQIVEMDREYLAGLFRAAQDDPWIRGMYRGSCPECKGVFNRSLIEQSSRQEIRFVNLERLLRGQECSATMNGVQSATIHLLAVAQDRFEMQSSVAMIKADQILLTQVAWHRAEGGSATPSFPLEKFALDRTIDEQESGIVDLDAELRSAVATVDSELRQIASAMEQDFANQFYKRAMRHIRQASEHWDVRMGQIESTSIVTGDRVSARVSPGQTVQLDLPNRAILAKEILDTAEGLVAESQGLVERFSARAAARAAGPGGTLLADALRLQQAGNQLDQLAPPPNNYRVESGNEVEITPIIQPDGQSISYRLHYPYSTMLSSPVGSGEPPSVVKHFIDTQVQTSNYEMQEVSRFRIGVQASRAPRGIPVLQDIPLAGKLFRTRESRSENVRETMIMADAVIYPSILSVTGTTWLTSHPSNRVGHGDPKRSELEAKLLQQSRERLEGLIAEELRRTSSAIEESPVQPVVAPENSTSRIQQAPIRTTWRQSSTVR